jgi:hypothetical protein
MRKIIERHEEEEEDIHHRIILSVSLYFIQNRTLCVSLSLSLCLMPMQSSLAHYRVGA